MKRAIFIGLVLAAAGALHAQSSKPAVQAPIFEVDPFWPKPLPNHWVTGSTIGLSVDAQDHVWTIHRPNTVEDNFKAADIKVGEAGRDDEAQPGAQGSAPALGSDRQVLQGRAAGAGLRPGRQPREVVGRPGPGLRLAGQQPRHHRRSQGQRLAGRQRRQGHAGPEVHERRQVPAADRQARRPQRQQRHRELLAADEDLRGARRPTRSTSPTATAIAASSSSTPTPASTSGTGAPTATSRDDEQMPPYNPSAPPSKQFNTVHCVDRVERRLRLRLRSRERSHPGVPQGRHVREGSVHRHATRSARDRCGT